MTYTVCICNAANREDTRPMGRIGPFDALGEAVKLVMERIPAPSRPYAAIETGTGTVLRLDEIDAVYRRLRARELIEGWGGGAPRPPVRPRPAHSSVPAQAGLRTQAS